MRARVRRRVPLRYAASTPGLPAHVRGASALTWFQGQLMVVQDDVLALGRVDPSTGWVTPIALPASADGRVAFDAASGTKAQKPDLESAVVVGDTLWALGSGGPLPARRRLVAWRPPASPAWIDGDAFFAHLARACVPDGGALNLEGACANETRVWLGARGGDAHDRGVTGDVIVEVDVEGWPTLAPPRSRRMLELGHLDGAALRLTDLARGPDGCWVLAAAERTTSYFDDGQIVGSAVVAPGGAAANVRDEAGATLVAKLEGLALDPDDPTRAWAVDDADDPAVAATLFELELR